ncbi:lectin subunit alpha-like [Diabrotica undecimpunctata]|uniref:lectin subunit alpha-like n=1 Tax=Diabrotica undecimpunctata TaxID=50387 RepID=UPI003B63C886
MNKECLIVTILLISVQAFNVPNNASTQHRFKINETSYVIELNVKANFFSAIQYCNFNNMQLVSVDTLEENSELYTQVSNIVKSSFMFWSSGSLLGSDQSTWIWMSTGKAININGWRTGEPNTQELLDLCLSLWSPKDESGWWIARPCTNEYAIICEQ